MREAAGLPFHFFFFSVIDNSPDASHVFGSGIFQSRFASQLSATQTTVLCKRHIAVGSTISFPINEQTSKRAATSSLNIKWGTKHNSYSLIYVYFL